MWNLLITLLLVIGTSLAERQQPLPEVREGELVSTTEEKLAPLPQEKLVASEGQRQAVLSPEAQPGEAEDSLEDIIDGVYYAEDEDDEEFSIPDITPETVAEVLKSETLTKKMIDCVIYFHKGCPSAFEKVNRVAPQIFQNAGRCPTCSPETNEKLRHLLSMLQRRQPGEYRRMIKEFRAL